MMEPRTRTGSSIRPKAPWITNTMFSDSRLTTVVQLMENADVFGDTAGLVVLAEERAVADVLAATSAFELFIERFQTDGVDSVVLVEKAGIFGASEIVASDLRVQVLFVDSAQIVSGLGIRGEVPLEDLADGEPDWLGNIRIFCTPLRLFEIAAGAAGPLLTNETFLAAAEGLGEIDLPFTPFASLEPDKHDAADAVRLTEFDPTIPPVGGAIPFGPLLRREQL